MKEINAKYQIPKSANWIRQREKIISVSRLLFRKKGYLGTSISDIEKAASINRGTIYYYIESKSDLLYEISLRGVDGLAEKILPIANSTLAPADKLEAMVAKTTRWQLSNGYAGIGQIERRNLPPKQLRAFVDKRDRIDALFRRVIGETMAQDQCKCNNPKLAGLFVIGLINSVLQWYKPGGELSSEEIASEVRKFVSEALRLTKPAMHE